MHYLFFSTLSALVDRLLTISVKRHASSQLCISNDISYTIKVFNSLMMEREIGFKVFKINSNTFYIASFFYLPNSKFKDYVYMWVNAFWGKKNYQSKYRIKNNWKQFIHCCLFLYQFLKTFTSFSYLLYAL